MNKCVEDIDIDISLKDIPWAVGDWISEEINRTVAFAEFISNCKRFLDEKEFEISTVSYPPYYTGIYKPVHIRPTIVFDIDMDFCIRFHLRGSALIGQEDSIEICVIERCFFDNHVDESCCRGIYTVNCKYKEPLKVSMKWVQPIVKDAPGYILTNKLFGLLDEMIEEYNNVIKGEDDK